MTKNSSTTANIFLEYCVIDNGVDFQLSRTLDSIQPSDDISVKIVPVDEFYVHLKSCLQTSAEYIMCLYSGTVIRADAVQLLMAAVEGSHSLWYYSDEIIRTTKAGRYTEKRICHGSFSPISFSTMNYIGEGLIISRDALRYLTCDYRCSHITALLTAIAEELSLYGNASYIPEALISYYARTDIPICDINVLKSLAEKYRIKKGMDFSVRYDSCKSILSPNENVNPTVSVVRYSGALDTKVLYMAMQNDCDVLCFMSQDISCAEGDITVLSRYAAMNISGAVSPQIYCGDEILYYGAYQAAGICPAIKISKLTPTSVSYIGCTRDTKLPSYKVWAIRRSLLHHIDVQDLTDSELMHSLALQLTASGLINMYIGNIVMSAQKMPVPKLPNFVRMLYTYGQDYLEESYTSREICPHNYSVSRNSLFVNEHVNTDKKVLILSHELSLTGAPIVLVQAAKILKHLGWTPVVISPTNGDVRADFEAAGIPVIICGNMEDDLTWTSFIGGFDLLLVNTIVPWPQIKLLGSMNIPVLWWLHDARFGYEIYLWKVLPNTVGNNIHIYSVSEYARKVLATFRPKYTSGLLAYGLDDVADSVSDKNPFASLDKKHVFVSVGSIIDRKGQDILTEAIELLPEEILSDSMFYIIGKAIDCNIFEYVERSVAAHPDSVTYIESIPHDEIMNYYKYATAVICPSRDDPLPTYMSETMMLSGLCICSANTGTAAVIENGVNGWVYHNDDPAQLAECICDVLKVENVADIKKAARKTFEENFTTNSFEKNIAKCIDECMNDR